MNNQINWMQQGWEDWRPTLQQQFDKLVEYERKRMGDNISPLGGDR